MPELKENVSLAPLTTFHLGGPAKYFLQTTSIPKIKAALEFAKSTSLPVFILGGGSNILVNDKGFSGLVIQFSNRKISISKKTKRSTFLRVGGGSNWDSLVQVSIKHDLQGIECLSGIPGTVGAAPVQNIGAYGQELADVFVSARVLNLTTLKVEHFSKKTSQFNYRTSIFKQTKKYLVLDVTFKLKNQGKTHSTYQSLIQYLQTHDLSSPSLLQIRHAVLTLRSQKLPDCRKVGNAGSFFQNPILKPDEFKKLQNNFGEVPHFNQLDGQVKLFAGWLIEQTGWKGKHLGSVAVSPDSALVLINPNLKGTTAEVKQLSEQIIHSVQNKFGITLIPEVQYI